MFYEPRPEPASMSPEWPAIDRQPRVVATGSPTPFERSGYRRPAACDRGGATGVVLIAAAALVASVWQWSLPPATPSSRPAPALAVFDVAPAARSREMARAVVEPRPASGQAVPHETTMPPLPAASTVHTSAPISVHPATQGQATTVAMTPPAVSTATASAPAAAIATTGSAPSSERSARANWQGDLLAHLKPLLRYPRAAERDRQQGIALVAITVERDGKVRSARIARGSGYPLLDGEAVATVKRGSPLPPPTADIPGDPVAVELPIQFSLRG